VKTPIEQALDTAIVVLRHAQGLNRVHHAKERARLTRQATDLFEKAMEKANAALELPRKEGEEA